MLIEFEDIMGRAHMCEVSDIFLSLQNKGKGDWILRNPLNTGHKEVWEASYVPAQLSLMNTRDDGMLLFDMTECSPGIPVGNAEEIVAIARLFKKDRKRAHTAFFGGKCACGKTMQS